MGTITSAYGLVVSGPAFLLPYSFPGNCSFAVVAVGFMYGPLYGLRANISTWSCDLFPAEMRATDVGLYSTVGYSSTALAPAICSLQSDAVASNEGHLGSIATPHKKKQRNFGTECL